VDEEGEELNEGWKKESGQAGEAEEEDMKDYFIKFKGNGGGKWRKRTRTEAVVAETETKTLVRNATRKTLRHGVQS
jgi:hypothetical protein